MNKFYTDQARGDSYDADDLEKFFVSQAGTGIATYGGFRYHRPVTMRGNGFFGRLIKGGLLPLIRSVMPYLGGKAVDAVGNFADHIKQGKSFKSAAKSTVKKGVASMARDLSNRMDQEGDGLKKRGRKSRGKKGKLNPGLQRYLDMKRQGLIPPSKKCGKKGGKKKGKKGGKKSKKRVGKKSIKQTRGKATAKPKRPSKSRKTKKGRKSAKGKPVNLLW